MAGNDWWQPAKGAKRSTSAKAPFYELPRFSGSQSSASVGMPGADSPPASGRGAFFVCELPSRQASKASRTSAAIVAPSTDTVGVSTKPVHILRRPKQADTAASSSESQQGRAVPLFGAEVQVQGSPGSDASPQGQPVNRKARRAHMQWQSTSPVAQVLFCTPASHVSCKCASLHLCSYNRHSPCMHASTESARRCSAPTCHWKGNMCRRMHCPCHPVLPQASWCMAGRVALDHHPLAAAWGPTTCWQLLPHFPVSHLKVRCTFSLLSRPFSVTFPMHSVGGFSSTLSFLHVKAKKG